MINGVMHIVAAVLFAVISVQNDMNMIWMGIAGVYLVMGVGNLLIHALKIRKMEKAAQKARQNDPKSDSQKTETTTTGG